MDQYQYLVNRYLDILSLSKQMLNFAEQEEWQQLVDLEDSYLVLVQSTVNMAMVKDCSITAQQKITEMLKQILSNEAKIKELLQQRMDKLSELIGQSVNQQKINTSYGKISRPPLIFREK
jgi:flagellar protein FliT